MELLVSTRLRLYAKVSFAGAAMIADWLPFVCPELRYHLPRKSEEYAMMCYG